MSSIVSREGYEEERIVEKIEEDGCFHKKGEPPDLYRVLYDQLASHGRGLSFVRLGS